jgi:hypothetical protein
MRECKIVINGVVNNSNGRDIIYFFHGFYTTGSDSRWSILAVIENIETGEVTSTYHRNVIFTRNE